MKSQKKRKWTVFFIIKAVGGSICETIKMINEVRMQELNSKISVVICLNFAKEHLGPLLTGDESFIPGTGETLTPTTVFLELMPGANTKFPNDLHVILERSTFDITDPYDIEKYFKDHILRTRQASHYLLFTWDHGKGYGIFEDTSDQTDGMKIIHQPEVKILTMEELKNAISCAFGKRKIDLVVMMNCLMQMVDTGYALRNNAKYLVAPQTDIDFRGYNYSYIFQAILDKPNIKPRKLAKLAVRSFSSKVYINRELGNNIKSKTAIFAVDLRHYTTFGKHIDQLVFHLLSKLNSSDALTTIRKIRIASMINSVTNFADLYTFLDLLRSNKIFDDVYVASLMLSVKDLLVIESYIGDKLTVPTTGLIIYFPDALPENEAPLPGFDEFFETEFIRRTKWLLLIEKML